MKKNTNKYTRPLILLLLFTNVSPISAAPINTASCHINARVNDSPPLYYLNESQQWAGLTIDLTKVLLKEAGCSVHFENINWARSLELMKTGKLDMMMNMSITEERQKYIHFIGPHSDETIQLLLRKDTDIDTVIQSLDDIKQLPGKIGYQQGTFFGKAFDEKLKNDPVFASKFEKNSSQGNDVKKLKLGRIIGIMKQAYSGVSAESELIKTGKYNVIPFIINKNMVYFGFSKKTITPRMLKRLQHAFQRATQKKSFQKVIDRYKQ